MNERWAGSISTVCDMRIGDLQEMMGDREAINREFDTVIRNLLVSNTWTSIDLPMRGQPSRLVVGRWGVCALKPSLLVGRQILSTNLPTGKLATLCFQS